MRFVKKKKTMDYEEMVRFVRSVNRAEFSENPRVYSKAIRVALSELGYDDGWMRDVFRPYFEGEYFEVMNPEADPFPDVE